MSMHIHTLVMDILAKTNERKQHISIYGDASTSIAIFVDAHAKFGQIELQNINENKIITKFAFNGGACCG